MSSTTSTDANIVSNRSSLLPHHWYNEAAEEEMNDNVAVLRCARSQLVMIILLLMGIMQLWSAKEMTSSLSNERTIETHTNSLASIIPPGTTPTPTKPILPTTTIQATARKRVRASLLLRAASSRRRAQRAHIRTRAWRPRTAVCRAVAAHIRTLKDRRRV